MTTGAGLRPIAKAVVWPPDRTVGAPALDPTDERDVETGHGEAIEAPPDERGGKRQAAPKLPRHIPTLR